MSAFYDEMADTAAELLDELGQTVTVTRLTAASYDTATAQVSTTPATSTVKGAETAYRKDQVNGELIQVGDKQVLIAALDTSGVQIAAPAPGDSATLADGVVWPIKALEPINPAATAVAYLLLLRK